MIFIIVCGAGDSDETDGNRFDPGTVLGEFALVANAAALIYFAYLIIARPGYGRGDAEGSSDHLHGDNVHRLLFHVFRDGAARVRTVVGGGYLLYFVAPLMALADYLLFCRKGEFTAYSPVVWAIIPVLFNIAVFIVNRLGLAMDTIPYFNLMGMNLIATLFVFLGISYLLFVIDNLMAGRRG